MLFCVNFGTHHEFDRRLIYNNLLFSEETFQVVFTKKVACLHEKTSLFMLFCVNFGTHHEFDRRLIYNNLLFSP